MLAQGEQKVGRGPKNQLWKPGQSGNPSGRRKESAALTRFRETTNEQFIEALQRYGHMHFGALKQEMSRDDVDSFDRLFGGIILDSINGDDKARQLLIDRLFGKVKENLGISIEHKYQSMSDAELLKLSEAAHKVLSAAAANTVDAEVVEEEKDEVK